MFRTGTAYEYLLFQATNFIASKKGLASCKPKRKSLVGSLATTPVIAFGDGSAANRGFAKPPGKNHLPFVCEILRSGLRAGWRQRLLYSTVRRRQFHWRSAKEPHGEKPQCAKHTSTVHRQFAAKADLLLPENSGLTAKFPTKDATSRPGPKGPVGKVYLPTRTQLSSLSSLLCARHHPLTPNGPRLPAEDTAQLSAHAPARALTGSLLGTRSQTAAFESPG